MRKRRLKIFFLLLFLTTLFFSCSKAEAEDKLPLPVQLEQKAVNSLRRGKILLNFEGADIKVVAKLMSELTNKNIIIDDRVNGRISIFSTREVTPNEAWKMFVVALNTHGYDVVDWGKTAKIIPIKEAVKEKSRFYSEERVARGEDYLVGMIALKNADPNSVANVLKQLVSDVGAVIPYSPSKSILVADDAYNVKRLIKIARHLDTVRNKPVTRTFYLKNSSSTEVARSLQDIYKGNQKEVLVTDYPSHNAVIVMAPHHFTREIEELVSEMDRRIDLKDRTRKFRVIQLQNADAEEVAKILSEMLKEGERVESKVAPQGKPGKSGNAKPAQKKSFISHKVSADKETNSIILYITDSEMEEIKPMLAKLDAHRKQVLVTAVIAEVSWKRVKSAGANWQVLTEDGLGGAFGGGKSLDALYQLLASGNFIIGGIGEDKTTINIGGRKFEFPNVFALIQFLNEDNDFNILSMPKVLTLDHKDAMMNVGSIIPFASGVKFDSNGQPVVTYDYKDVGLTLEVTPHIGQGNLVKLQINQKIQDVTDYIQQNLGAIGYVVPVVSNRNVKTTITLKDSQTVIIGGLVSRKTIESIKKVPLLGDIPILGAAFKNRKKEKSKTVLFIFLTPHVIETPDKLNELSREYKRYSEMPEDIKEEKEKLENTNEED